MSTNAATTSTPPVVSLQPTAGGSTVLPIICVHQVSLPVSSLDRSLQWYSDLLGFEKDFPLSEEGVVHGWALRHPLGPVGLALVLDPARATQATGFAYFSFALPDEWSLHSLEQLLTARKIEHGGIVRALGGLKMLHVHDPDGHKIGFHMGGPRVYEQVPRV